MAKKETTAPVDFVEGFAKAVAGKQKVWQHDRLESVGASEAFDCHRATYFKKREPENIDEDIDFDWGHTERGNIVEDKFAVPMLQSMFGAENCLYMGEDQKTFVDGRLSATPDGIVIDQPRDALAKYDIPDLGEDANQFATEIKSFGGPSAAPKKIITNGVVRYQPKPNHLGQNNIQLGMFRRQTNFKPAYGIVLYINPVKYSDIRAAPVKYDDAVYLRAKQRADDVFDLTKGPKDFKAEGKATGRCDYCIYTNACSKAEQLLFPGKVVEMKSIPNEIRDELKVQVSEVVALRAQFKDIEARKKKAEAALKDAMFDLGTTRVGEEDWSASISKNNGRKTLSKDLITEAGLTPEDYMTEGNPFFVLRTKGE